MSTYDIEINLTCQKCGHLYKAVRILPCGQTLCNQCISMTISSQCLNCQSKHILPTNGFAKNDLIEKILHKRAQNGLNSNSRQSIKVAKVKIENNEKANEKREIENIKKDSLDFLNEVQDFIENGLWDDDEEKAKWINCKNNMAKLLTNDFDYRVIKREETTPI